MCKTGKLEKTSWTQKIAGRFPESISIQYNISIKRGQIVIIGHCVQGPKACFHKTISSRIIGQNYKSLLGFQRKLIHQTDIIFHTT